jgi:hypothetical protein
MEESSSAKDEDGEFKRKKANEEVILIHLGGSFSLPTPETLRKTSCVVPGVVTLRATHTANVKGASGPLVQRCGSNHW